jgi:SWIM zinc finger
MQLMKSSIINMQKVLKSTQCVAKVTKITTFVKKDLEAEKLQMDQFKVKTVNDIEFVVSGLYGHSVIEQKVTMKEEDMQECTCESFKNMKLPCQHIAASVFHYNLNTCWIRFSLWIQNLYHLDRTFCAILCIA